ncbi:delta-sarcoglycan isoform 2-T7 [Hipposideros larvatus]
MPQEQYTHHRSTMPSSEGPQVYKVGIYGWRKRCLYFFVLLLMILILVNLAMTIWILKVMNFTIDGMGNLRITEKGLKLEGDSEFLQPLYAKEIQSRPGNALYFKSARNVTVNILNDQTKVLTQLITGPKAVEAYGQKFEVKTVSGKLLFSADNNEVVVGAERLRVLGAEGTVFPKSIETPNVRADPFKELRNGCADGNENEKIFLTLGMPGSSCTFVAMGPRQRPSQTMWSPRILLGLRTKTFLNCMVSKTSAFNLFKFLPHLRASQELAQWQHVLIRNLETSGYITPNPT